MYKLVTFDVYSALTDVEAGLVPAAEQTLGLQAPQARALVKAWRSKQLEYTMIAALLEGGHVPFETVTRRALNAVCGPANVKLDSSQADRLSASWHDLPLLPEAEDVISELARHDVPLALLSNGDATVLAEFGRRLDAGIEHVFAADVAGVYKPHAAVYRQPLEKLGLSGAQVLHVAGSGRDVMGAKAAGLACYWSNRQGETLLDPGLAPDFEHEDLRALVPAALGESQQAT